MEFAQPEIRRLEELRLGAIEARVDADLELGRHAALVGTLEALSAEHPTRERIAAQLMVALYRCGRQAEALDVYRRTRTHLSEELGPRARARAPGAAGRDPRAVAGARRARGRRGARAAHRSPRSSPASGPSGSSAARTCSIGSRRSGARSSRAARIASCCSPASPASARRASRRGWRATPASRARPSSTGARTPRRSSPTSRSSRRCAISCCTPTSRRSRPPSADLVELSRLVPELCRRLPDLPSPVDVTGGDERYKLFSAAAALLVDAAARAPVLIVLDDLHWADASSLRLLSHLARYSDPAPLLILGTYRDTDLPHAPQLADTLVDLNREHLDERILLDGPRRAGRRRAHRRRDAGGAGRSRADPPAGDPRQPVLPRRDAAPPRRLGGLRPARRSSGAAPRRCSSASGSPTACASSSSGGSRASTGRTGEALMLASVLGQKFDLGALAAVTERAPDELSDALEEALEAGLLSEVAGPPGTFEFSHALVRETLYRRPSSVRRELLHSRAGDGARRALPPARRRARGRARTPLPRRRHARRRRARRALQRHRRPAGARAAGLRGGGGALLARARARGRQRRLARRGEAAPPLRPAARARRGALVRGRPRQRARRLHAGRRRGRRAGRPRVPRPRGARLCGAAALRARGAARAAARRAADARDRRARRRPRPDARAAHGASRRGAAVRRRRRAQARARPRGHRARARRRRPRGARRGPLDVPVRDALARQPAAGASRRGASSSSSPTSSATPRCRP